jgi:hypothetical protein
MQLGLEADTECVEYIGIDNAVIERLVDHLAAAVGIIHCCFGSLGIRAVLLGKQPDEQAAPSIALITPVALL